MPQPPDRRIWVNGELVPWERATVHLLSHSLQRGSLIFDYMSVHETPRGAAVFRLREHVARFLRSAEIMELPLERSAAQVADAIKAAVRANPGATAAKVCAYLPSIEVDVVPQDTRVALAVAAYDPYQDVIRRNPGEFQRAATLRLWIEKDRRQRRDDIVPPQAKVAANYTSPMMAKWQARKAGYDEILLVDADGFVAEGPTTNFFWVADVDGRPRLRTPPEESVLPGITRLSVLEIAKHDGIAVEESRVRPDVLLRAQEVFLTGTTAGVWPVASIDGHPIGSAGGEGAPGPLTARLRERFQLVSSGRDPDFQHWLAPVDES